jgi:hypothetical protein
MNTLLRVPRRDGYRSTSDGGSGRFTGRGRIAVRATRLACVPGLGASQRALLVRIAGV